MVKEAKGTGATIDEARENAIKNLNASDFDDIQFDIIAFPKKKVLGIFGGSEAEVRAFVEIPDKKKPNKKTKKEKPAPKKAEAPKKEKTEEKPVKKSKDEFGEAVDADKISEDSNAGIAVKYVKSILEGLGCEGYSIKVASRENGALIIIDGEDLNALIGRRGETIDSLQYLTSLAANNGGGHYKISIDICNYRAKREETLIALANKYAAQALKAGKCRTLEPMNPYERRIIHTAIQEIEGVKSGSFGEGGSRRVVIAPENVELKPRMSNGRNRKGGHSDRRPRNSSTVASAPAREPKKDSDTPLYGKIN